MNTMPLPHRRIWELIPWVVNGSADAAERQAVEEHLRGCSDCRDEYAFQSRLHAGIAAEAPDAAAADAQDGLRRLLARIDAGSAAVAAPAPARRFRPGARALLAAVVVQAIGLALFAALLLQRERGEARYETLTHVPERGAPAAIRLVPAPALTLAELQALLAAQKLHVVESNPTGAIFGLAFDEAATPETVAAAVERLRANRGVLLAEPIAPAARR